MALGFEDGTVREVAVAEPLEPWEELGLLQSPQNAAAVASRSAMITSATPPFPAFLTGFRPSRDGEASLVSIASAAGTMGQSASWVLEPRLGSDRRRSRRARMTSTEAGRSAGVRATQSMSAATQASDRPAARKAEAVEEPKPASVMPWRASATRALASTGTAAGP